MPAMHKLLALACIAVAAAAAEAAAQNLVVTNARILDGSGGVIERGSVVVRDGKIVSVAAGNANAAGARVIDAKGMTLMPGFVEAHRHPVQGDANQWLKAQAAAQMQEFLDAGFTTVLSAGDAPEQLVDLRRRIERGEVKGPRLLVSGRIPLAGAAAPAGGRAAGGGARGAGDGAARGDGPARGAAPPAAGAGRGGGGGGRGGDPARNAQLRLPPSAPAAAIPAEQTRAAVAAHAKTGVDLIKTVIQVSPGGPEVETLKLVVSEGRKFNIPVYTHAVSVPDALGAVEAGVASLAHTPHIGHLTDAQAQTIANSKIPMVSTLGVFVPKFDASNTPLFRDRLPFPWETALSGGQGPVNARLLFEKGIVYGYGTDTSWTPRESLELELRPLALMFSPKDIVSIMTKGAAAAALRTDRGTLEAGKLADMVLLNGDPLANVSNLLNVVMTIKGGEIVTDKTTAR